MIRPDHLGQRISALVDGELGHQERDRALAHIAHCPSCRAALEDERLVKDRIASAPIPPASPALTARLLGLAQPGDPMPPRERRMPLAPVVPTLPAPGRRRGATRPGDRDDPRRPGRLRATPLRSRRARYAAVTAVSAVGLMLGTAFLAGAAPQQPGAPVLPPSAELSVEHAATTSGQPLGDPAFDAVTASYGGLYFAPRATGR
ncbi:MAG: zf-HC2 domain-containing protein [Sporichthyaceae bacterium]